MKTVPPTQRFRHVRSWIAIGIMMSVVLSPTAASAQCSAQPNTVRAVAAADSVFVGEVVSTDAWGVTAQVQVESIWKGRDLPPVVEVHGSTSGTAEAGSIAFIAGRSYLFVPENTRPPFLATACSATQVFTGPANLIPLAYQDAVGAETGREAAMPADQVAAATEQAETELLQSILPLLGAIVLIALTWAVISHFRGLEPERAASFVPEPEPTPAIGTKVKTRRRNMRRDMAGASRVKARTIKRNSRGFKRYRRKQERQVASSRKASGSTETS